MNVDRIYKVSWVADRLWESETRTYQTERAFKTHGIPWIRKKKRTGAGIVKIERSPIAWVPVDPKEFKL